MQGEAMNDQAANRRSEHKGIVMASSKKILGRLTVALLCGTVLGVGLPARTASAAPAKGPLDRELDKYWGKKRQLRTIQKRLFLKDTRWQFTAYGGIIPNDDFQLFFPAGLRVAYHLSESIGIEVSGAWNFRAEKDLRTFIKDAFEEHGTGARIFLVQSLKYYAVANMLWSPFYGKFGAFGTKLAHFDFYLAFGAGWVGLRVDPPGNAPPQDKGRVAANVGLGAMVYLSQLFAVRIDYRQFVFQFAGGGGGVSYPAEITLGLSVFTKAPH